jgi:hypothetical protein
MRFEAAPWMAEELNSGQIGRGNTSVPIHWLQVIVSPRAKAAGP